MDREKLSQYNTEYQKLYIERFADNIPESDEKNEDYAIIADFLFMLDAPEQYENEEEMLKFLKENKNATVKELSDYFEEITPPGLPPCASEWDESEWD